jgi:hypothetical protein
MLVGVLLRTAADRIESLARDSNRLPEGENSRSEVECEASQSGGAETPHRPNPVSDTARDALTKAAEAFRMYERSHAAKAAMAKREAGEDGEFAQLDKANRNRELAELCEAALTTLISTRTYEQGVEDAAEVADKVREESWSRDEAVCQKIADRIHTLTQTSPDHDRRGI